MIPLYQIMNRLFPDIAQALIQGPIRIRNIYFAIACTLIFGLFFLGYNLFKGLAPAIFSNLIMITGCIMGGLVFKKTGSSRFATVILTSGIYANLMVSSFMTGGIGSANMVWIIFIPIIPGILTGLRYGFAWGGISILSIITMYLMTRFGMVPDTETAIYNEMDRVFNLIGVALATGGFVYYYDTTGKKLISEMKSARKNAESAALEMETLAQKLEYDLIKRKGIEEKYKKSEAYYKSIFENTGTAIVFYDNDSVILNCNTEFERLCGYSRHEIIGKKKWSDFVVKEDLERMTRYHSDRTKKEGNSPLLYDFRFLDRTGNLKHIQVQVGLIPGSTKRVTSLIDITKRKTAEKNLQDAHWELESIFENSQVGIMLLRGGRFFAKGNQRLADILGYDTPDEMANFSMAELHISEENFREFGDKYYNNLTIGEQIQIEYQLRRKDNSPVWCFLSGKAIDKEMPPDLDKGVLWVVDDIEEQKQLEFKLRKMATRDSLTGLYNRGMFMEHAAKEFSRSRRKKRPLSILMIDADHFKRINDTHGHSAGDDVLRSLAKTGKGCIREIDIFGRLGGEEFAVLLPETDLDQAVQVGERIRKSMEENAVDISHKFYVSYTVSIGAACMTDEMTGVGDLLSKADTALYSAKGTGRNRVMK